MYCTCTLYLCKYMFMYNHTVHTCTCSLSMCNNLLDLRHSVHTLFCSLVIVEHRYSCIFIFCIIIYQQLCLSIQWWTSQEWMRMRMMQMMTLFQRKVHTGCMYCTCTADDNNNKYVHLSSQTLICGSLLGLRLTKFTSHINYSIAYPKPQNNRVLLGYCSHFLTK